MAQCCGDCTFCNRVFQRATLGCKSQCTSLSNKVCSRCFFCRSLNICPRCSQCQNCCISSSCRSPIKPLLGKVAVSRRNIQGCSDLKRRLYPTFQDQTKTYQRPFYSERLCTCSQERLPEGGIAGSVGQKCCRKGQPTQVSSLFQQVVFGSQTKQQMEANLRPECPQQIFEDGHFQDGDPGNHTDIPQTRRVGHVHRFQGRVFPHSYSPSVPEVPPVPLPRSVFSVQGSTLWSVDSTNGVYHSSKRGQTHGSNSKYQDPPVPRRLGGQGKLLPGLHGAHQQTSSHLPGFRLGGQHGKIRAGTQTGLRLCRVPIRPQIGQGETHSRQMEYLERQGLLSDGEAPLHGEAVDVSDRLTDGHREVSAPGEATHETNPVAFEKSLEDPGIDGKMHSDSKVPPQSSALVAAGRECPPGSTLASYGSLSTDFYGCFKRGLGGTSGRSHVQRDVVTSRNQVAYQLTRTESSSPVTKGVSIPGVRQNSVDSHRQHDCGRLHQQARGHEIRVPMCPSVENSVLVRQKWGTTKSPTHPRQTKRSGRQVVTPGSGNTDGVVTSARGFSCDLSNLAHPSGGLVCDQVQQQVTTVCLPGSGPKCLGSGLPEPVMGEVGSVCLPPDSSTGKSAVQTQGQPLQENNNSSPRVAKNAMVLGSSRLVSSSASVPPKGTKSVDTTVQSGSSRQPLEPKSARVAPRATSVRKQGFSEAVACRIEAPQRISTRTVYAAKWAVFARWCHDNQVDVGAPPVKSIADFLLYLFQERGLQPGTIDGYRSAIADRLGNNPVNISKDENITRLLDSFHRDRPKGRRGVPSWNLSLVLHQLTKPPFEPLHEASLKYLTFKTVFLMALASGKRRSEIHAWVFKNIRNQADWSKVSMYPSPSFLSKNQLARDGPASVAPVVIPALAPTLDRSLREDRTLCPIRALKYYMEGTSHLRQNKELVFVSFKKGFDKDISPSTISSWIKKTVIFCYEQSDQESQTLHRVKAHDVRAFAASKAFHSGMSLEQLLSACHWKSHNTFTQFYLKDVAWADAEQFHLGPVVAAQQVHQT